MKTVIQTQTQASLPEGKKKKGMSKNLSVLLTPETINSLDKTEREIIWLSCEGSPLSNNSSINNEIKMIIMKICLLLDIPKPTDIQVLILQGWIVKNYLAYSQDEILLAFEL